MRWSNFLRGILIGIIDLIPGVSGGTVAFVLGIYDELLAAFGGIFSRQWRRHVAFLLPLGLGMGTALLAFSRLISYMLQNYFIPTQMFFLGLIVGVLPMLVRRSDAVRTFRRPQWLLLAGAAMALAATKWLNPDPAVEPMTQLTALRAAGLFLAGGAAAMAMLLPGISGSFVLLVLGVYPTAIHALATLSIPVIAVIGAGVAFGLIGGSKLIRLALHRYPAHTYAAVMGLIVGSLVVLFPGFGTPDQTLAGFATAVIGFVIAFLFGRQEA